VLKRASMGVSPAQELPKTKKSVSVGESYDKNSHRTDEEFGEF